jgi:MarR-like DNA-binding transcriptional regulator SgrR of sgrS sRNA
MSAPLTVEMLQHIEESTDRQGNPSLVHLREIATTLKTTVSDLVEPDTTERALAVLQEWTELRTSARFGSAVSDNDRKRILRMYLYRVLYSLDDPPDDAPSES